jgi:hypothetical protein
LGRFVAFVKTVIASKYNSFGGFWPSINWRSNYATTSLSIVMDIVDLEDLIQVPYCGLKNMRPLTTYTPFRDLNVGDFMFMRPHDLNLVLLDGKSGR